MEKFYIKILYFTERKPIYWKSLTTGNTFEYKTHSTITERKFNEDGYKDPLPIEEYPYTIIYEEGDIPSLKNPSPSNLEESIFDSMLNNIIVLHYREDWEVIDDLKELFKKGEDFISKFGRETINFVMNEMSSFCNKHGVRIYEYPMLFNNAVSLIMDWAVSDITNIDRRRLNEQIIPKLINEFVKYEDVRSTIDFSVKNNNEIEIEIDKILNKYPEKVAEYKKGKLGVANMMFGELMRSLGGKCNPKEARELLNKKLA